MKRDDKKISELNDLPLPHGWQICAFYFGVWWLISVFSFSFGYRIRLIAFVVLVVLAVVCVVCIIAAEGTRWKRSRDEDTINPPT